MKQTLLHPMTLGLGGRGAMGRRCRYNRNRFAMLAMSMNHSRRSATGAQEGESGNYLRKPTMGVRTKNGRPGWRGATVICWSMSCPTGRMGSGWTDITLTPDHHPLTSFPRQRVITHGWQTFQTVWINSSTRGSPRVVSSLGRLKPSSIFLILV